MGGRPPRCRPTPQRPESAALLVAGIGGTGVVTVGQVLSTAANLEGLDVSSVDQTGMAQKGGPVVSHLRIGAAAHEGAARLEEGRADGYLVFDLLTGVSPGNLTRLDPARTRAVVSTAQVPTGAMVSNVDGAEFPDLDRLRAQLDGLTLDRVYLDAESVALARFGSQPAANLIVVGIAYQRGLLPPAAANIERAIELNGVAVETNVAAFRLGRAIAVDPALAEVEDADAPPVPSATVRDLCARVDADDELATVLAWRVPELVAYQNVAYATRYVDIVARVRRAETAAGAADSTFSCTVARNLFHLMAYKDEYEVARLHRDPRFRAAVEAEFGQGAKVTYLLQPPIATRLGLHRKIRVGSLAAKPMFGSLARMKGLRGKRLDPFGRTDERRGERRQIDEYVALVDTLTPHLGTDAAADATRIAGLVDTVRGYAAVKERNLERYERELAAARARHPPRPPGPP